MPSSSRSAPFAFVVALNAVVQGRGVAAVVTPVDEHDRLTITSSTVIVSLWRENASIIRGKIAHRSGAIAYFQSGEALLELARILQLEVETGE